MIRYFLAIILVFSIHPSLAETCSNGIIASKSGSEFGCIPYTIQGFAYPTAPQQANGAVFLTIHNNAGTPLRILEAQSDIAETVELHTHTTDGDTMMMREVEFFEIPALTQQKADPTGDHIMLLGLKQQLNKDTTFPLRLKLEKGGDVKIDVQVKFLEQE